MRTLLVLPTYLQGENIEAFLVAVRDAVPDADILVADDASPDGTAELAEKVGIERGGITVLRRPSKDGLGAAYRDAFARGLAEGYEVLVQIDADFSHDPAVLPELLARVEGGAQVAIGSRYVPGGSVPHWPVHRRALSRYANRYASALLHIGVRDATAGFRAYRAEALRGIAFDTTRANGYGFQIELAYRASRWGGPIVEVPIAFTDRVRGTSKMSWRIIGESMALVTWWGLRARVAGLARRARR